MTFSFDHPASLLLALLAVPMLAWGWVALRGLDRLRRATALALRALLVLVLAVALAGPNARREHDRLTVIGLLDVSGSVRTFGRIPSEAGERRTYVRELGDWFERAIESRRPDDRFGLVVFDGSAIAVAAPTTSALVTDGLDVTHLPGTSIADAIRLGLALFPADSARRLVLVTDGNETAGDALAAAREAAGAGRGTAPVPIDVLPIEYRVRGDVRVERIEAPTFARPGQTVTVRIILESTEETTGRLWLRREGEIVDLDPAAPGRARAIRVPRGSSVHLATVDLTDAPVNRFEARFEPDDPAGDALAENDRAEAFTPTPGRGRVLVISSRTERPHPVEALLEDAPLRVVVTAPADAPADLLALQNFDLVVLDDVAAFDLEEPDHERLARYVHDLGGGLIMIGGPQSFGAGGWNGTALAPVLPLELDPPKEIRAPAAALVIVLDQSGSMLRPVAGARASQQEVANGAAAMAIESLRAESLVGVVAFHDRASIVVPLQPNEDSKAIARRVRSITAGGGTDLEPALTLAYDMLRDVEADRKHIVCLTDGQSQTTELEPLVEQLIDANIRLTTIGVGDDADHDLLRRLAELGQGEYRPVLNPRALPRVLVDSVQVLNRPLIKEVPFVPQVRPTGSMLTAGMTTAPALGGIVVTGPRDDPRAIVELAHPDGEPLLAHWQAGLGRVAAFTSDLGGRWSSAWSDWPTAAAFWVQLVTDTARPQADHDTELIAVIEDGRLDLALEATERDGRFIDYLEVEGTVYPPEGDPIPVRLSQTAPGHYGASLAAPEAGNYIVALNPRRGQRQLAPVIGGASQATGIEYRRYESNLDLLERIVAVTGGRTLDRASAERADLFDHADVEPIVSLRPAWRLVAWLALGLLMLDIAARRIAWSSAGVRAALARAVRRTAPAHERGAKASATLATLRRTSADVERREDDGAAPPPAAREPERPAPARAAPDAQRVADVLSRRKGRAAPDEDAAEPEPSPPREEPERAASDTTSSLFAAKARARRRLEEN